MEITELVTLEAGIGELGTIADQAQAYLKNAQASNTRRAYRSDWADFTSWCSTAGLSPLPASPDTVALYIAALANNVKPSTIQRRLSSISQAHQAAELDTPTNTVLVRKVWAGIRRTKGCEQHGKAALLTDDLRQLLIAADRATHQTMVARDRALLLIGFAGAFRRSELVGLEIQDAEFVSQGVVLHVRRSKTDQDGQGLKKAIPFGREPNTCPVLAIKFWIAAAGISEGPVFRRVDRQGRVGQDALSDQAVALVIKKLAITAGLDPTRYAGHSLRSGHATQAAVLGTPERIIMKTTGHQSAAMVRRYIRDGELFKECAAANLGL